MSKKAGFLFYVCLVFCLSLCGSLCLAAFPSNPSFILENFRTPMSVEAGDLNNDGKADLIVSCWVKSKVYIFYQKNGIYQFPADKELTTFPDGYPLGLKVGDFDNDGKNDLAVVGVNQYLHLFPGKENFSVDLKSYNVNQWYSCQLPAAGKLSKNGIMDFLVGCVWRKWLGQDKFQCGLFYGPKTNNNSAGLLADLNKDKAIDVVFQATDEKVVRIYYGPFSNMLVKPADVSEFIELSTPFLVGQTAVADLNADGRLDIIASSVWDDDPAKRQIFIYYQNLPIGFTANAGPSAIIAGVAGLISAADFNRDGLADLAVAENGCENPKIHIFYQKKGKPFAKSVKESDERLKVSGFPVFFFKAADINGDGYPDILIDSVSGGIVKGYINSGK